MIALIHELLENQRQQDVLAEREKEIRRLLAEQFGSLHEGTQSKELPEGTLRCKLSVNRTVDQKALVALIEANPQWRKSEAFSKMFQTKYALHEPTWKNAPGAYVQFLKDVVTERPGLPVIEWKEKK